MLAAGAGTDDAAEAVLTAETAGMAAPPALRVILLIRTYKHRRYALINHDCAVYPKSQPRRNQEPILL